MKKDHEGRAGKTCLHDPMTIQESLCYSNLPCRSSLQESSLAPNLLLQSGACVAKTMMPLALSASGQRAGSPPRTA